MSSQRLTFMLFQIHIDSLGGFVKIPPLQMTMKRSRHAVRAPRQPGNSDHVNPFSVTGRVWVCLLPPQGDIGRVHFQAEVGLLT